MAVRPEDISSTGKGIVVRPLRRMPSALLLEGSRETRARELCVGESPPQKMSHSDRWSLDLEHVFVSQLSSRIYLLGLSFSAKATSYFQC